MKTANKKFDCVEMKRHIQQKIYEETRGMDHGELSAHLRKRIAASRFASFLERPVSGETPEAKLAGKRDNVLRGPVSYHARFRVIFPEILAFAGFRVLN